MNQIEITNTNILNCIAEHPAESSMLGILALLVPVGTFYIGRYYDLKTAKRNADKAIFQHLNTLLSGENIRGIIDDTWNMQYTTSSYNKPIQACLSALKDSQNSFHNSNLLELREKFDSALKGLFYYISSEFSTPIGGTGIMNLQSLAPHGTERYERVSAKVNESNDELELTYQAYTHAAKRRLIL